MENSMMDLWPVDPGYIILGLAVLTLILLIIVIICLIQMRRLYRRYDYFMRGKDAETLEEIIMEQMVKIHQYAILCAPTNSQYAAIEGLKNCDDEIQKMRTAYNERRRYLMHTFKEMGLRCFEPFGAFYVFPNIQEFGMTSEEFATELLREEKVAVVPGSAFGASGEGYIRISYAYSLDDLKEALGRVNHFIEKLRKK